MILAISMSKPSGASDPGFLEPMPGWSNLTPILMVPASLSLAIVVPAANEVSFSTSTSGSSPPQAVSARASAAATARLRICRIDMVDRPFVVRPPGVPGRGPLWIVMVSG